MPYAILRFQKRKAGGVAACERHNERKKEAYKSNPDIDMERSKNNYHLIAPPKYTYKKEINRMVAEAGCRTRKGDKWYVGAITNWDKREISLDFSFLSQGLWRAEIFKDGINADRNGNDYKIEEQNIVSGKKLKVTMAPGGGWSAIISRIN